MTKPVPHAERQARLLQWIDIAQQAHDQAAAQNNIVETANRIQAEALVRARTALAELRELLLDPER